MNFGILCTPTHNIVDDWEISKKQDFCPLTKVPPHGDLIDRGQMREIAIMCLDESVTDQEANGIRGMWSHLGQMPVIIPADKEV